MEDPNVITVQIQHSPKKKNRVGPEGSSGRMLEMTEFDQEFVTRKLQSASDFISEVVLSPMEDRIFTPKATHCKGIITMKVSFFIVIYFRILDIRFGSKVGQIGPNCDESGTFKD